MFIALFENFLKNLSADVITNGFFFVLLAVFCIGFLTFCLRKNNDTFRNFSEYSPVLLTSMGILGTFTGVVAGLLNFDVNDIDGSITTLLGGMKTAFLTSVIGIFFSISLKVIYTILSSKKSEQESNNGIDISQIVDKFYLLSDNSSKQINIMNDFYRDMKKISDTLGSDSDSSLLGQMKLLRTDLSDNYKKLHPVIDIAEKIHQSLLDNKAEFKGFESKLLEQLYNESLKQIDIIEKVHQSLSDNRTEFKGFESKLLEQLSNESLKQIDVIEKVHQSLLDNKTEFKGFENKLWIQLQEFADMMSKSATEAVIEALKKVIQEFNNNLTEQFGENFKELNRAVIALIDWQENYKNQLNQMISLYDTGVQALTVTEDAITKIEGSAREIPTTMDKLSSIIATNQQQIDNLEYHLSSFAELRDKAVSAVPEIQKQIQSMLDNMRKGNDHFVQSLTDSSEYLYSSLKESSASLSKSIDKSANDFTKHSREVNELLASNAEILLESNQEFQQMSESIKQFAKKWQREFDDNIRQVQERLAQSIREIMERQLLENTRLMKTLEEENKNALKVTTESVRKQLGLIDTSMETELQRVMEQMGGALATISGKFTEDYKQLVDRMVQITNYRG